MFFLLLPLVLPPIAIAYFLMGSSFKSLIGAFYSRIGETYNFMTDGEFGYGSKYSVLRHSRPFVVYQGTKTSVTISVFGKDALPSDRRVYLQRRGYRTGLLGWTIGGLLGGSHLPGIEVTPVSSSSTEIDSPLLQKLQSDIDRLVPSPNLKTSPYLQTMIVHIPVSSGDGYFRLVVTSSPSPISLTSNILATSPIFRVGSMTLSTAQPRGATPIGLVPELLLRTLVIAGRTAAMGFFFAAFPFLKIASLTPGPWKAWAARVLYQQAGGEERFRLQERMGKMNEQLKRANEQMYKTVPFGAVGVRTAADMLKDEELGRQGTYLNKLS